MSGCDKHGESKGVNGVHRGDANQQKDVTTRCVKGCGNTGKKRQIAMNGVNANAGYESQRSGILPT